MQNSKKKLNKIPFPHLWEELWGAESLQSPTLTGPTHTGELQDAPAPGSLCWRQTASFAPLWKHFFYSEEVLSLFWSSAMESLHYSCPNSAIVFNWCYSQYISTLNCLKLEFSDNDRFNHPCSLMAY